MKNITATQGDTIKLLTEITRTDPETEEVAPVDLSSAKLWFTAKYNLTDTDEDAVIRLGTPETGLSGISTTATPTDGKITTTIPPGDTEGLSETHIVWVFWDIELLEADATKTTVDHGRLALTPDVTTAGS